LFQQPRVSCLYPNRLSWVQETLEVICIHIYQVQCTYLWNPVKTGQSSLVVWFVVLANYSLSLMTLLVFQ
jgi:hypothetical protein